VHVRVRARMNGGCESTKKQRKCGVILPLSFSVSLSLSCFPLKDFSIKLPQLKLMLQYGNHSCPTNKYKK